MLKAVLIVVSLIPGLVQAVVCRTVDADGVVSYTEVPTSECKAPVRLRGYAPEAPSQVAAAYQSIRIVHPEMDAQLTGQAGKVPLVLVLEPPLRPGHGIRVFLDGALVPGDFDGLAIELTGVEEGEHRVRAAVFDAQATRLIESSAVRFQLHETLRSGRVSGSATASPRPR